MRTGRPIPPLILSDTERETLQRWSRRPKSAQALALRARMVLLCEEGNTNTRVAQHLDVRIQTTILVDDEDAGMLLPSLDGFHKIAAHLASAFGRLVFLVGRGDALVIPRDLIGEGILRSQSIQKCNGGHATDGELGSAIEKAATVDTAVGVVVIEVQDFLGEFGSGLAFHGGSC